jgi:hypothetical protein
MDTLLVAAIIITAVAVVTQAGALIAMYLMARHVADNVNGLVNESRKLMVPLNRVTANLETVSEDLVVMGKDARVELQHVKAIVTETETIVREEVQDLRMRLNDTVDEVQTRVTAPFRNCSALASGISAGVRHFFSSRRTGRILDEGLNNDVRDRDSPAA